MKHKPIWNHDCDQCKFLGTYNEHDLYYCKQGTPSGGMPTLLARYGGGDGQYLSGMAFGEAKITDDFVILQLRVAWLIAKDMGLIK
jgi:hypothetical protein